MQFRAALLALSALVALPMLAAPAAALDLDAMTAPEREAFRAEVRDFLMDNPEVLVEAMDAYESRQQALLDQADAVQVALRLDAITDDGHSWVGGNLDGDVTIVEFMDYRCGYCRRAFQEVEDLVSGDGGVRFVLKEFPILGEQSEAASRFAIAVQQLHGADAYKDTHDALMALEADITPDTLARLAEGLAIDPAPVLDRMASAEVTAVIEANLALARDLRISGTPTFVLGGRMLRGYVPLDGMLAMLAEERAG